MPDNEYVTIGATDGHKINLFLNSRGAVVEETFRLDLNQSWEAIDIKTLARAYERVTDWHKRIPAI